ncbi:alpha/beta hydrolase [Prosthecobacter sp.]|jgi:pimeloyl-ACP methyl ester carboxylesterase|uniref:alpha/beta hydrolase n=1 Tax=Prosthecobacter sp. TaxID=1965333 RepID=UPI003783E50E
MPLWKNLLRLLAIALLTPVIFLLGCQSSLIYHPHPYRAEFETMLRGARGQRVTFTTSQGRQTAFYIPPKNVPGGLPRAVWLCFGGNGSLALDWLHFIGAWDENFAYLLVDYPGYGDCEGKPTPGRIRESGNAAFEALARHLQAPPQDLQPRLAVLGHSLGSAAALMAAEDLDVRRGVLLSPFTSMTDMGRIMLGWPLCHLNLHRFDNRKTLRRVAAREGVKFVIFHGVADEVIPVRMGRDLAAAHPKATTFHEVPGAHHNDILSLTRGQIGQAMTALVP